MAVVTVRLAAASSVRPGRRLAIRTPSSSATGRWADSRSSQAARRGGRVVIASARSVLRRAPRMAGGTVADPATATVNATTAVPVPSVTGGAATVPSSPAPMLVSSGAIRQPRSRPAAAASTAITTCSASSTAVTSRGVAPTALSSPARRPCAASRPPTSTVTQAADSMPRPQAPVSRAACVVPMPVAVLRFCCQVRHVKAGPAQ